MKKLKYGKSARKYFWHLWESVWKKERKGKIELLAKMICAFTSPVANKKQDINRSVKNMINIMEEAEDFLEIKNA